MDGIVYSMPVTDSTGASNQCHRRASRARGMEISSPTPTAMRMIHRLIGPSGGRILLDDEDVTRGDPVKLRRRMGYVIQQVGLFPHETVAQNVSTVPHLLGWDRKRVRARVDELLNLVGLDPAEFRER